MIEKMDDLRKVTMIYTYAFWSVFIVLSLFVYEDFKTMVDIWQKTNGDVAGMIGLACFSLGSVIAVFTTVFFVPLLRCFLYSIIMVPVMYIEYLCMVNRVPLGITFTIFPIFLLSIYLTKIFIFWKKRDEVEIQYTKVSEDGKIHEIPTNFDVCCNSKENMAQIIDIAKVGWSKEEIMEWLEQPIKE